MKNTTSNQNIIPCNFKLYFLDILIVFTLYSWRRQNHNIISSIANAAWYVDITNIWRLHRSLIALNTKIALKDEIVVRAMDSSNNKTVKP
jgi:hypothetical protein